MIVFITNVFHTLGKIDRVCSISITCNYKYLRLGHDTSSTLKKLTIFGRIIENCGQAATIFNQKSGSAMAKLPKMALCYSQCSGDSLMIREIEAKRLLSSI